MRVRLKGINRSVKRLANGTVKTFWYAWRGGPRLQGEPGSPEFIASYNAAVAAKIAPPRGTLQTVLQGYQASETYRGLAPRTREDYAGHIKRIEKAFGDFPLSALSDLRTRGVFLAWRDKLAATSRRQADYTLSVLARILAWGIDRGLVSANPCEKRDRLYRGGCRVDKVWSREDEDRFLASAPERLHLPLLLALWTGQRQGDLLRLPWSGYDGSTIRLRQRKTGVRVLIPCGAPLKAALDAAAKAKRGPLILVSSTGRPWTRDGFKSAWRLACKDAGVSGLTYHDLRGTAVTRLALAGCTEAEIATISGHSLRDVRTILDSHYLSRDPELGLSAIRKLEARTKLQTKLQTMQDRAAQEHGKDK
jgi:integrase